VSMWSRSHLSCWILSKSAGSDYSYFSATTAFILDARHAGYSPASTAIPIGKSNENAISSGVKTGVNVVLLALALLACPGGPPPIRKLPNEEDREPPRMKDRT